jgi:hypothetical protein
MKNTKLTKLLFLTILILVLTTPLFAQLTAEQVMWNVYERPLGNNMSATLNMTITNARGAQRERSIVQFRQNENDVERKIMFFTAPADVRNTSFLNYSYSDGKKDDQWIYLPALGRVRRIASDKSNDSFMGSDFTYDDMGARYPLADQHKIIREENFLGWDCYVIESTPNESNSEYVKTLSWIIKDEWIGLKKEFVGRNGSVVRLLTINDYDQINSIWVITDMTMTNVVKNTSTTIKMNDVSFDNNLRSSFFTERQMSIGPRI